MKRILFLFFSSLPLNPPPRLFAQSPPPFIQPPNPPFSPQEKPYRSQEGGERERVLELTPENREEEGTTPSVVSQIKSNQTPLYGFVFLIFNFIFTFGPWGGGRSVWGYLCTRKRERYGEWKWGSGLKKKKATCAATARPLSGSFVRRQSGVWNI